jgi:hypothetical protein
VLLTPGAIAAVHPLPVEASPDVVDVQMDVNHARAGSRLKAHEDERLSDDCYWKEARQAPQGSSLHTEGTDTP